MASHLWRTKATGSAGGNLLALTPTQHFNYAHPNGRTQEINIEYQKLVLLLKADRIKENIEDSYNEKVDRIYESRNFFMY